MKTLNLLLLIGIIFTACAPDVPPLSTEETLDEQQLLIQALEERRAVVDALLADAKLRHDSLAFECEHTRDGGRLSFFREEDDLRLLRYSYYNGDRHGGVINAYVAHDSLFYAHVEEGTWSFDQEAPQDDGILHIKEDYTEYFYYYGVAGAAIRCLQKNYIVRSSVELPLELEKIQANEISCGGAQVLQAFFSRVRAVETAGALIDILCTDG